MFCAAPGSPATGLTWQPWGHGDRCPSSDRREVHRAVERGIRRLVFTGQSGLAFRWTDSGEPINPHVERVLAIAVLVIGGSREVKQEIPGGDGYRAPIRTPGPCAVILIRHPRIRRYDRRRSQIMFWVIRDPKPAVLLLFL